TGDEEGPGIARAGELAQLLAHAPPGHGLHEQARRAIVESLQAQEAAELAQGVEPQDDDRLADRLDPARQVVVARVDAAQDPVGERHILAQQPLDLIERVVLALQRGREAQRAEAVHRYATGTEGLGLLQEVALKALESQLHATLEFLAALDVLGDELEAGGPQLPRQAPQLVGGRMGDLQFDDIRHFEEARVAVLRREVVESDAMASRAQRADALQDLRSGAHVLENLDDDASGLQRQI